MKNIIKTLGIAALAAVIIFSMAACDDGGGSDGSGKTTYTVTFNSDGGSAVSAQRVDKGGKAAKPATDPTKAYGSNAVAGFYDGTPTSYTFIEWRKQGESTAFDFDTPINSNITLVAQWKAPVSIDLTSTAGDNIIEKAVAYIKDDDSGAAVYTLVLGENVDNVKRINHDKDGVTLTVTSVDTTERIISATMFGDIFFVGKDGNTITQSSVKLVLDGNVTLKQMTGTTGNGILVNVKGGNLELKGSAKISDSSKVVGVMVDSGTFIMSGGTISNNNGGGVRVVSNYATSAFTMSGGTISGNRTTGAGGGVNVAGGTFTMSGGTISGNTANGAGGVSVFDTNFTMTDGTISGNTATNESCGGVDYVESKPGSSFSKTGGTIYGPNEGANSNTGYSSTGVPGLGDAVRVATYNPDGGDAIPRYRSTTAGPEVNLSSTSDENWE